MISANTALNSTTKDLLYLILRENYDANYTKRNIEKRIKLALAHGKTGTQLSLDDYLAYDIQGLVNALTQKYQLTNNYQLLKIANDLASPKKNLIQKKFIDYSYGRTVNILRKHGYHVVFSFSDTITFYWRDSLVDKTKVIFNEFMTNHKHDKDQGE